MMILRPLISSWSRHRKDKILLNRIHNPITRCNNEMLRHGNAAPNNGMRRTANTPLAVLLTLAFFPASVSFASWPNKPLVVDQSSRVVVMEYEAWFGPQAVTFQGTAAKPFLQSKDMKEVGGGYDSADPAVMRQQAAWLQAMGMDAALIEVTNNVSCIFNSAEFLKRYGIDCTPEFRFSNRVILQNTGNLYATWTELGAPLKLIPMVGGIDQNVLYPDIDGKTAFEKEIDYFGALMRAHPNLSVIYHGKPLILIYLGAAQDPDWRNNPLWYQLRQFLEEHLELTRQFTFQMMAGYLDSQPLLWADQGPPSGPEEIAPKYGFWSWVDRLNPSCTVSFCPYYPTYNRTGARVENLTVAIATAGQNGWDCDPPNHVYCPDASLRFASTRDYATFESFMSYARQLQPIFLFVHQFNEYVPPDEGWDAQTDDDIEPADLWGRSALDEVRLQIQQYREHNSPAE